MKKRSTLLVSIVLLTCLFMTLMGSTLAVADIVGGEKVLRFATTSESPTFDPQLMNAAPSQVIGSHVFEPLMRSHSGEVVPGAAESYEISDDGLTYTFHLRDGLWSDGEPVRAQDFEYGIKRLLDPEVASAFSFIGLVIKNGSEVNNGDLPLEDLGVTATDDKTLVIELAYPADYFLGMLVISNFCPTRQDIVEAKGTDFANGADGNVYNGPFIIDSFVTNDRVTLAKNENYWNADVVQLDKVEILTVSDANTQVSMFETGDLDFVEIPTEQAVLYPDAQYYYSGANDYLKLNHAEGYPTQSKNLRLALNYGISRADYITLATQDVYEANLRFVLPQVHGVDDEYGTEYPYEAFPLEGDVEQAQAYLAAALEDLGMSDPSELTIELLTADTETSRIQAEVIQAQYETNLGINVTIKQVPYRQRLEMEDAHDFTMVFTGWMPDYSDPYSYLELWTTDSPYNHASYNSETYDKYIEDAIYNSTGRERMDNLFAAEQTFCEDGVVVALQLRRIPYMMNENLTGFEPYFVGLQYDFLYADFTE